MRHEEHPYSGKENSQKDAERKRSYLNSKKTLYGEVFEVGVPSLVFDIKKHLVCKIYLYIFVLSIPLSFIISIFGPTVLGWENSCLFYFVMSCVIYSVLLLLIYIFTVNVVKLSAVVVSQKGISIKDWMGSKHLSWEEVGYFVPYHSLHPLHRLRLDVYDHHEKRRMIIGNLCDCDAILKALEEKRIPEKTKPRKCVTWRWR